MVRNSLREAVAEYDGQLVPRAGEEDFYGTENAMFLLLILYLAFIGLGLPDPLLGAAWPILQEDLGAPLAAEGLIYIIISGGTVISAAQTARVLRHVGTGMLTALCTLITGASLLGMSLSTSVWGICAFAVPLGLGAGAVDSAINHFLAVHYSSRHQNWVHGFWGLGATIGPYLLAWSLMCGAGWQGGYRTVACLQLALAALLFARLKSWNHPPQPPEPQAAPAEPEEAAGEGTRGVCDVLRLRGARYALTMCVCYCGVEALFGNWTCSFLVVGKGLDAALAAKLAALFFLSITFGRFGSGLIANRLGDVRMLRLGTALMLAGVALLLCMPQHGVLPAALAIVLFGVGCAPIYPTIMHLAPPTFGHQNAAAVISAQMVFFYIGSSLMPLLFGGLIKVSTILLFPLVSLLLTGLLTVCLYRLYRSAARPQP